MADNDNNHQTPQDRLTAILGLLADDQSPQGPTPDLQEIQAWHLGKLDAQRAAEVKSHVARDPNCYQMWSELVAAEAMDGVIHKSDTVTRTTFLRRFTSWWTRPAPLWITGGMATAMIVVLAILFLPANQGSWSPLDGGIITDSELQWPYLGMSGSRGGELSYRQKQAIQNGIRTALEKTTQGKHNWSVAIDSLPVHTLSCEDASSPSECKQQTQLLQKTGVYAGVMYVACLQNAGAQGKDANRSYWDKQNRGWKDIADNLEQNKLTSLATLAASIHEQAGNKTTQCRALRSLIYLSFQ